jgi:hypothetical protein
VVFGIRETRESYSVFKERAPGAFDREKTKLDVHALDECMVPGAGIEPASLESKASVLPLDDPEKRAGAIACVWKRST